MFVQGTTENFLKNIADFPVWKVNFLTQMADLTPDLLHVAGFYLGAVQSDGSLVRVDEAQDEI